MAVQDRRAARAAAVVGLPALGTVAIVAVWWLATLVLRIEAFLLPSPPDGAAAFGRHTGYLLSQTWVTLRETGEGFGLSAVAGMAIGLAVASSRVTERMLYPLLVAVNAVPKIAVAPLLVVWLGFGELPKVAMVFLVCFFPIVISTAAGLVSTPAELVELSRSLDASWWQTFAKVPFPGALPP